MRGEKKIDWLFTMHITVFNLIRVRNTKAIFIPLAFVLVLGCSKGELPTYSLTLNDFFQTINDKRIFFLSEGHFTSNSEDFLIAHLEHLHESGLRVIFFEQNIPQSMINTSSKFPLYYPWHRRGWKYESMQLARKITEINKSLPPRHKIKTFNAEEGFPYSSLQGKVSLEEMISKRDQFAFKKIKKIASSIPNEAKILIFYGDSHGARQIGFPLKAMRKTIKEASLGKLLSDYYAERFVSIDFQTYFRYQLSEEELLLYQFPVDTPKVYAHQDFLRHGWGNKSEAYDYTIVQQMPQFATYIQYHPSVDIILSIAAQLLELSKTESINLKSSYSIDTPAGQYYACIYFLKLLLRDNFQYSLYPPRGDLQEAIQILFEKARADEISDEKLTGIFHKVRSYHGYLITANIDNPDINSEYWIENLLYGSENAYKLNPNDAATGFWYIFALFDMVNSFWTTS